MHIKKINIMFIIVLSILTLLSSNCKFLFTIHLPPEIMRLTATPDDVNPGETSTLFCEVSDENESTLNFKWDVNSGQIIGTGNQVTWIAPDTLGSFVVRCTVINEMNLATTDSINIQVSDYKVLFIGNSYTGWNKLPKIVKGLAQTVSKKIIIGEAIIYGRYLDQLCSDPAVIAKIYQDKWDYVLLQGAGFNLAYPSRSDHKVVPAVSTFDELIHDNWIHSKTVYIMPWAFKDGITWIPGETDDYEDMQIKILDRSVELIDKFDLIIAPVGWAWYHVIVDRPEIELFSPDMSHPSREGSYLAACVIHCVIFKEHLINVNYYNSLPPNIVQHFQTVASDVVMNNLTTWNIK